VLDLRGMRPLSQAQAEVEARSRALPSQDVPLAEAGGRVLARAVAAARDLPGTDISMMDGYALRRADAGDALRVVYEVAAGDAPPARVLRPGEAARIFTGAPVPAGADCVVMQEHATRSGAELRVEHSQAPKAGQHIRRRGEEVRAGATVLPAGTRLGAAELSLAAACEAARVHVHRRPRVAILTTGDELVALGQEPAPGKLVETNSQALAQLAREAGAEPLQLGIARDSVEQIAAKLADAQADVLVTTGGASVGDHDHAQAALERLGGELIFHTVAIRPGKPVLFGTASRGRLVFGLPGIRPRQCWDSSYSSDSLCASCPAIRSRGVRARAPSCAAAALARSGAHLLPARPRLDRFGPTRLHPGRATILDADRLVVGGQRDRQIEPGEGMLEPGQAIDVLLLGPPEAA